MTWSDQFVHTLTDPWAVLGFFGQALFFSRWVVQWWASERKGESHVPLPFWIISLLGGAILFVYAVKESQPVFMLGQLVGILTYSRNIVLLRRKRHAQKPA